MLLVAMIYSSAGYGGGSSYLAIMAMINLPYKTYPILALLCNLIVVSGSSIKYIKNKLINWKKVLPWIIPSIPFAILGSQIHLPEKFFLSILAILLFIAGIRIILNNFKKNQSPYFLKPNLLVSTFIGSLLGLISGIVGIGGGIFLSPIMNYWKMDLAKNIAIITTLFIFFNSFFALVGKVQYFDQFLLAIHYWPFILAVFIGGQIGSHWCIYKATEKEVAILSGILSIIASITLILKII